MDSTNLGKFIQNELESKDNDMTLIDEYDFTSYSKCFNSVANLLQILIYEIYTHPFLPSPYKMNDKKYLRITEQILDLLCNVIEEEYHGDDEYVGEYDGDDEYDEKNRLKELYQEYFQNIVKYPIVFTNELDYFFEFFRIISKKMYDKGNSSLNILYHMQEFILPVFENIVNKYEGYEEYKERQHVSFDGGNFIKWKDLPIYFENLYNYNALLQGVKNPDEILTCDEIKGFNKLCIGNDKPPLLYTFTLAILYVSMYPMFKRETLAQIRSLLNYDFGDEEIVNVIQDRLTLYIEYFKMKPIGIIVLLYSTLYNKTNELEMED